MKTAAELENNEDKGVPGENNVYPDPTGRPSRSLDAPWGELPEKDQDHIGDGAWKAYLETHVGVLRRVFTNFNEAARAAKSQVNKYFESNWESKAPLLSKAASSAMEKEAVSTHAPPLETLSEKARKILMR